MEIEGPGSSFFTTLSLTDWFVKSTGLFGFAKVFTLETFFRTKTLFASAVRLVIFGAESDFLLLIVRLPRHLITS